MIGVDLRERLFDVIHELEELSEGVERASKKLEQLRHIDAVTQHEYELVENAWGLMISAHHLIDKAIEYINTLLNEEDALKLLKEMSKS